jgi:hypothetical protein
MNARCRTSPFWVGLIVSWLGQLVTVRGIRQELDGSYVYDVQLDGHTYSVPEHKLRF